MQNSNDTYFIKHALTLAKKAADENEVPVGAVLVYENQIIAEGWNQPIQTSDPTAHAEIMALRKGAQQLNNYRLENSTLYVTLEPCLMCAGAILNARIKRLVYGAIDPKAGAVVSQFNAFDTGKNNHQVWCDGGLLADECLQLLQDFFEKRRS
ncbi:MAG: tRNA adenosine(34) deaminase TadA [Gammaproteobacteria bacterium]